MINNRFIIITTAHNVEKWISMNIETIHHQSYKNFFHLIINDKSTDGLDKLIDKFPYDYKFKIIDTPEDRGGSQGDAFMYGIEFLENNFLIKDEDIIIEVDGDDWLSSVFVFDYLNQIYQDPNIWMTYGQYQIYPTGQLGGHFDMKILNIINDENSYRKHPFPYSHLKTYKYWLFNKINRKDLIDPKTEKTWNAAWDHALCLPMVEMAGKKHIYRCEDILYILNRSEELKNEGKTRTQEQKEVEQRIRNLKPYNKL